MVCGAHAPSNVVISASGETHLSGRAFRRVAELAGRTPRDTQGASSCRMEFGSVSYDAARRDFERIERVVNGALRRTALTHQVPRAHGTVIVDAPATSESGKDVSCRAAAVLQDVILVGRKQCVQGPGVFLSLRSRMQTSAGLYSLAAE